ncbi:MAG: gliding motility-associated C-terminal domain-containing protein [Lewinellaceae bacterium]|nr:gliding motility-associated C-terminal domain-containing protein [Lewinellaceae bacterium]
MRNYTHFYRLLAIGIFFFTLHSSLFTQNTPCAAVSLPNNMSAFQTYSTSGLNNSGVPYPGCGGNVTVDIWFAVVAPPSGDMDIALKAGTMVNMAMAFYKGPCNNLMLIDCTSDDNCGNPLVPAMQYDNLQPGVTYYIRIWPEGGGGNFQIRVTDGDPPQTPLNFTPVGTSQTTGPYCMQMTSATTNQAGCGWDPNQVNFSQPFTKEIVYNFGTLDPNGADGICMIFQNSPAGTGACGTGGGGLAALGITNSFIIEFDTWDNGPSFSDIPQDHASIDVNGVLTAINGPVPLNGGNIEDGQDHLVTFSWTPGSNSYVVTFDNIPVLTGSYNIVANCLGGNPLAYYGVSASTGGSVNVQTACTPEPEIFPAGSEDTVYAQICQGETYFAGGSNQSNTGIYFDIYNSYNGCDSTIITYLTVFPNSYYAFNAAVCQGGSVTVGNTTYNTTGVHTTTLTNWRGCDSVVVLNLTVLNPQAVINMSGSITCNNPLVTLDGTGSSTGPGMTFQWTGPSPACISPSATSPVIQVGCPGVYTLTVKHQIGNVVCSSTTSVTVTTNIEAIVVDIAPPDTLTCQVDCTTLDASGSTNGPNYTYSWTGPNNFSSNQLNPEVCLPGNYSITITNPNNGCTSAGGILVVENAATPTAQAGPDVTLSCNSPVVTLNGSNSSGGNNLEFTWMDETTTPLGTDPTLEVSSPGTYILSVVNPANNCSDLDTVVVAENFDTPTSDAGPGQTLDCTVSSVTLDGSNSSSGPDISFEWQNNTGGTLGTTNQLSVGDAGTYLLIVTNDLSGCTDTSTVDVLQDLNAPVSDPGPDQTITCADPSVTFDGSGSSMGPEYVYQWQDENGQVLGDSTLLTVSGVGAYYLLVINNTNNCVDTAEVLAGIDTLAPVFDAGPDAALTCSDPDVLIGDTLTPPVFNWLYQWVDEDGVTIGSNPTQSVNQPGTYTLIVTDQTNGCAQVDSVLVTTDDALPVADAGPPTTLNCLVNTADLGGTNTTTGPSVTYTWTDPGGSEISSDPNTSTTVPGTFTLTVLNTDNGCQSSDQVTIALDTLAPVADAGPAQLLNCFQPSSTLDGSGSDQGPNFTYEWTQGGQVLGTNVNLPVTDTGTYVLTVLNTQNGCTQSDVVQVAEDFVSPTVNAGPDLIIDCGTNSVTLDGAGSSSGAEFAYEWMLDGLPVGTDPNILVSEAGLYFLQVTNTNNGCIGLDSALVALDANAPVANAGADLTLTCTTPQTTLDGSGSSQGPSITYVWTLGGATVGTDVVLPVVEAGIYTLSVTNLNNGCVSTSSVQVAIDTLSPQVEPGAGGTINCLVSEIELGTPGTSSGPQFSYEWILGGTVVGTNENYTGAAPGDYTLVVTNTENGCQSSGTTTILEDLAIPTAQAGQDLTLNCYNPTGMLDGAGSSAGPEFVYEWQLNGSVVGNALSLPVSDTGLYVLTILNTINGCEASDQTLIAGDFEIPLADPGADVLLNCLQPSSTLMGTGSSAGPEFTYAWTLGGAIQGTDMTLPVTGAGTYTLTVFNTQNGCESSATADVLADFALPTANAGANLLLNCYNPTGLLLGAGSSVGMQFTYEWNSGGQLLGTEISLPVSDAGTYTLTVFNTDNGCEASDEAEVTENFQTPTADAGADLLITCDQPTVTLDGSGSSGGPGITSEWTLGGSFIGSGLSLPVNGAGNYTLTVTDITNGCSASDQTVVGIDQNFPQAFLQAGDMLTCVVLSAPLDATGTTTGSNITYDWNTLSGGSINLGAGPLDASVTDPGTYQLIVLNTQNGCADTAVVDILQDILPPVADAGPGGQLNCFQSSISLNGNGSQPAGQLAFEWSTSNGVLGGNSNSATPLAQAPGDYLLTVTNLENGCTDTDQVTITSTALANLAVSFTEPGCHGDPASISIDNVEGGAPPYQYSIDGGVTFSQAPLFADIPAGGYSVVVQDMDGCTLEEDLFISDPAEITVAVTPQLTLTLGESFQLHALTNIPPNELGAVLWTPAAGLSCSDCLDPLATPLQNTTYTVLVTNLNGCSAEAVLEVLIERPTIYVPNTFSPNFDGINDVFLLYTAPGTLREIRQMRVFDRWGGKVFEAFSIQPNDIHAGWNGTHRGKIVDVGVFAWMAEVEWADGTVEWLKGDVTVVR